MSNTFCIFTHTRAHTFLQNIQSLLPLHTHTHISTVCEVLWGLEGQQLVVVQYVRHQLGERWTAWGLNVIMWVTIAAVLWLWPGLKQPKTNGFNMTLFSINEWARVASINFIYHDTCSVLIWKCEAFCSNYVTILTHGYFFHIFFILTTLHLCGCRLLAGRSHQEYSR